MNSDRLLADITLDQRDSIGHLQLVDRPTRPSFYDPNETTREHLANALQLLRMHPKAVSLRHVALTLDELDALENRIKAAIAALPKAPAGAMYCYSKTGTRLWSAGYYDPKGYWQPESDHTTEDAAAARVRYLNGGA